MSIEDVLIELRKTYLEALPQRVAHIEKLMSQHEYSLVETEFHKLKGTGKTYGLPEISQIGEVTERLCENGSVSAEQCVPTALRLLQKTHESRIKGTALDLTNDPDFLYLSEVARELHETTAGRREKK